MDIAIYGKGGIGKSTISANITAALSESGKQVLQIGCDPKHDSTRLLLGGGRLETIAEYLRRTPPGKRALGDVVAEGYEGCLCAECGGPEPGIGCAGRGIITSLDFVFGSGMGEIERDVTVYDVLGDVVCGGFAVPLRDGYAQTAYIVSSGEYMSIYAANNIIKGICNYDERKVGGIIFNSRGDPDEERNIRAFSEAVNVPVIASFGRSELFKDSERNGRTVVQMHPDSAIAEKFRALAKAVLEPCATDPRPMTEEELEGCILGRSFPSPPRKGGHVRMAVADNPRKRYMSRNVSRRESYYGCAFSGACTTCASIEGLRTVLHSPTSCAQLTFQSISSTYGRYGRNARIEAFADPKVSCTHMRDDDIVFGGKAMLRAELERSVGRGEKDIAVITSCASGIIGDDVRDAIEGVKTEHPDARIVPIAADGCLNGDFVQGVIDAAIALVDGFSVRSGQVGGINLIGTKPLAVNTLDSVRAITRILDDMGIEVNCVLPGCGSVASIERAGSARMNLLMSPDVFAVQISTFLNERFGMPTAPVSVGPGIGGTLSWVRALSESFGCGYDVGSLEERLNAEFDRIVSDVAGTVKGRKVAILSATRDMGWIVEAIERAGMVRVRTVIVDRSDYSNDTGVPDQIGDAIYTDSIDIAKEVDGIRGIGADVVISSVAVCDDIPNATIPLVPEPDPMAGALFVRRIALMLMSCETEGWRKDAVRSGASRWIRRAPDGARGRDRFDDDDPRTDRMQVPPFGLFGTRVLRQGRERMCQERLPA